MSTQISGWVGLLQTIRQQLITASGLPAGQVGIDVLPERTMSKLSQSGYAQGAVITVFDQGAASNTTRWSPLIGSVQSVQTQAQIQTPAGPSLPALGVIDCMIQQLGSGFIDGDAVGVTIFGGVNSVGQAATVALPGETPQSLAVKLAAAINGDPVMSTWVTATTIGPILRLTSLLKQSTLVYATAGNMASRFLEYMRQERSIQISLWTKLEADRQTYGQLILQWIAESQQNFGPQLPDTSMCRLKYNSDQPMRDTHFVDLYRWCFLLDIEVSVLATDDLYSVLGIQETTTAS